MASQKVKARRDSSILGLKLIIEIGGLLAPKCNYFNACKVLFLL